MNAGGMDYWQQTSGGAGAVPGNVSKPIYQQVAAGLYVLDGGGRTIADSRITMNIGHGTIWKYAWRTITLLAYTKLFST